MDNWVETTIDVGIETPFKVMHLTDSHISLSDGRNDSRKLALAQKRRALFDGGVEGRSEQYLKEQLAYAKERNLPILYTGDFCDFVSEMNLEYMRKTLFACDCFFAAGNHEYSLYVGEAFEDEAYKLKSFAHVQSYVPNDLRFDNRIIGGINFVAVDNVYYNFTAQALEQLKEEVKKNLPIVLVCHTPFHTNELAEYVMTVKKNPCAYTVGAPDSLVDTYPQNRAVQQRTDRDTQQFIDYVYSQPLIRAVLAGHAHDNFDTQLPSGIMQYVTGGGYRNCARIITFK